MVLHEALTGARLFQGASPLDTVERLLHAPVPAPSAARPEVPAPLDAAVLGALARDPAARPDAAALAAALDPHADPRGAAAVAEVVVAELPEAWARERDGGRAPARPGPGPGG